MGNGTAKQGPGRRPDKEIADRRLQALAYLEDHWPGAAELLDAVHYGNVPAQEIADKINLLVAEAEKKEKLCFTRTVTDAVSVNPEQALAGALEAWSEIAAEREDCSRLRVELTAAVALLDARSSHLDTRRNAQHRIMMAALAARPPIDREIYKRAHKMVRGGAARANGIRRQQAADRYWDRPVKWTSLPQSEGALRFVELPHERHRVATELLPPADDIAAYVLDPDVEQQMIAELTDGKLRQWYIKQIQGWLAAHYPGDLLRPEHVVARAWYMLVMRAHPLVQTDDLQGGILLPSPWTVGKVVEVTKE